MIYYIVILKFSLILYNFLIGTYPIRLILQNEVREEVSFIINAFTDAGLNYKGKTKLSLTKLGGKYLNLNDMKKLQVLMAKLETLTEKEIRNQKK